MGEANIDRARMVGILKEIFLGAFEKECTYRTVGVFFEELSPIAPKQLSVFEMKSAQSEKHEHLAAAVEKLKGRF